MAWLGKRFVNLPESDRIAAFNTVQAVVVEQPHKIPLLAGAIQVANGMESSIGKLCVESFHVRVQEAVDKGKFNNVKLMTRFICALYPMIADNGSGVFKLLNVLLDRSIALQKTSEKRNPLAQELYTAVLLAIPYLISSVVIADSPKEFREAVGSLINKSQNFPIVDDAEAIEILNPWESDKQPYEPRSFVQLVRSVIDNILANNLTIPNLLDIPVLIESDLPKDGQFVSHVFPAINFPENIADLKEYKDIDYQTPRLFFSVYLPDILQTVPLVTSLESVLLRDISTDIINNMDFNRKEVARQLITLDLFFGKDTFAEPGISMDRLQTMHAANPSESTWKVEDVAMESVLECIFKVPTSAFYGSYFHAILVEACIMAPQAIAPVFGRAIRFLYSHLTELDIELQHRFLDWFSQHLSNFGFSWKWQEWKDDVNLPDLHPRKVFMEQLILKEVRLSYAQRVKETLPAELVKYVVAAPEGPVNSKFFESESQYQEQVHKLMTLFREGNEKEDIDVLLQELSQTAAAGMEEEGSDTNPTQTVIDIVVSTICQLGNRSISHSESWIDRSKEVLLDVCINDYTKTVESVLEFWKFQPYVGLLVVMQLVTQKIVPPHEYIKALFEATTLRPLLRTNHGWEMLLRVLDYSVDQDKNGLDEVKHNEQKARVFGELLNLFSKLITEQEEDVANNKNVDIDAMEVDIEASGDSAVAITGSAESIAETNKWAVWWSKGTIRSLVRRYFKEFQANKELGSELKSEYISGLLEQARAI